MATTLVAGSTSWSMTRDSEGHREYKILRLVRCDATDGPANALRTAGLSRVGDIWNFDGDVDLWAWCRPETTVTPKRTNEPNKYFEVEQTFSTKPAKKCNEQEIENPLLEPQKISGGFQKITKEAVFDMYDVPIMNSAFELFRGPQVEFDEGQPTVHIEQNVAVLNLALCESMLHTVNETTLWGLSARCIKLSNFTWEKKYYGMCGAYYTRIFDFDINRATFDRVLLDEGNKALSGHWHKTDSTWVLENIDGAAPDPNNPLHFNEYLDRNGNPGKVILNGIGVPANTMYDYESGTEDTGSPGRKIVRKYPNSNFLLLGIPIIF